MSTRHPRIIEVAIPLRLDRTFHYRVPSEMERQDLAGRRALVPFGRRRLTGYILGDVRETPPQELKEIAAVLDPEPLWTDNELEFFRWVASYYLHPLGDVLKTALPAGINIQTPKGAERDGTSLSGGKTVKTEVVFHAAAPGEPVPHLGSKAAAILEVIREGEDVPAAHLRRRFGQCSPQLRRLAELGLVTGTTREVYRNPFSDMMVEQDAPRILSTHQQAALDAVYAALDRHSFAPFLLNGVTGSGKTEVYLQAIARTLEQDKNALVLVPEIALTPQLVRRFLARFGHCIAVLHSGLSDGERYDEWRRIRRGQARIVIGARSAIFAPLAGIGIIIVDEEHEASFKQGDGLRYNARDLALVRGRLERAVVLLGSATPLITSMFAAQQGKMVLLNLPERVEQRPMPAVELASMKGVATAIGPLLAPALEATLAAGEQAIIFLNRRGFATYLICAECDTPLTCPNCSVSLTYHRQRGQSVCHYCDYAIPAPGTCPACGCHELKELGAGTERLEHDLRQLLPQARLLRMDSDTTGGKGSHGRLLARMFDGSADILVGTQMIAKGHDFPGVTLVGVVNAEASLSMPDFRAAERTFQLLSQVIGRAGRGDAPGRVVVQAQSSDHYAIRHAVRHDADAFYRQELEFRREAGYPPFSFLACLGFSGTAEKPVEEHAETMARLLMQLKRERGLRVEILGPAPAPLYRLRGRFRRQILLKAPARNDLRRLLVAWQHGRKPVSAIRETIDIDPVDMM